MTLLYTIAGLSIVATIILVGVLPIYATLHNSAEQDALDQDAPAEHSAG